MDPIINNNMNEWQKIIRGHNDMNEKIVDFITSEIELYNKYFINKSSNIQKNGSFKKKIDNYIKAKNILINFLFEIKIAQEGNRKEYLNNLTISTLLVALAEINLEKSRVPHLYEKIPEDFFLADKAINYINLFEEHISKNLEEKNTKYIIEYINSYENVDNYIKTYENQKPRQPWYKKLF